MLSPIDPQMEDPLRRLQDVISGMESVLVAFSGGIDSALVLKVAHDVLGDRAVAVTSFSPAVASSELETSRRIAREIGAPHHVITSRVTERPEFFQNSPRRCFACKEDLYSNGSRLARKLGLRWLANGTQLDDLKDFRPGLEAARAFGVRSPLVEAGLGKSAVRRASRELGLADWDKPADACLSSRIPFGTQITEDRLDRIEQAEEILKREGFGQVRVRYHGDVARIELPPEDFDRLMDSPLRSKLVSAIQKIGFRYVTLDLRGYRAGSLNPESTS